MTKNLVAQFEQFIEDHSTQRFSKNLRSMLFEFLMTDGAVEAMYLKDLLYDLEGLFELLDAIQFEVSKGINNQGKTGSSPTRT